MLTKNFTASGQGKPVTRQAGVVLIIALVVLVALTLAAITLVRSVDTNNIIAGNMAFQQAATRSADAGIETAIAWLEDCNNTHATCTSTTLDNDSATNGYSASGSNSTQNPAANQSWDAYWVQSLAARAVTLNGGTSDAAGNVVSYVVDRMCNNAGPKLSGASCVASPAVNTAPGNQEEANEVQLNAPSVVYYRITVRVAGPRNTVSYVQAMVSM